MAILLIAYPLRRLIWWLTSYFVVTSDRLIHREGWIAKHSMEIPLEAINDVRFKQTVFERIIGAGTLVVQSASESGREEFKAIRNPEDVQKTIYHQGEMNQQRMFRPAGTMAVTSAAAGRRAARSLHRHRARAAGRPPREGRADRGGVPGAEGQDPRPGLGRGASAASGPPYPCGVSDATCARCDEPLPPGAKFCPQLRRPGRDRARLGAAVGHRGLRRSGGLDEAGVSPGPRTLPRGARRVPPDGDRGGRVAPRPRRVVHRRRGPGGVRRADVPRRRRRAGDPGRALRGGPGARSWDASSGCRSPWRCTWASTRAWSPSGPRPTGAS